MKNTSTPKAPNKCMGRLPNLERKPMVSRSKKPLIKRSIPNFVFPYLRAWWITTFSVIREKPALLASTGI